MGTIRSALLCVAVVIGIQAVHACAQETQEARTKPAVEAIDAVYRVICNAGVGTAFGHRSGKVISAAHVVAPCDLRTIVLIDSSGTQTKVTQVDSDPSLDVALLTTSTKDYVKFYIELSSSRQAMVGAQVLTLGFPEGYPGKLALLSVGYLAGVFDDRGVQRWAVNGAFNPGNSGGPLLDVRAGRPGQVIGVISSKYAPIPPEIAADLRDLEANGSAEGKKVARILREMRRQSQLVIGFAALSHHLIQFLSSHGVQP